MKRSAITIAAVTLLASGVLAGCTSKVTIQEPGKTTATSRKTEAKPDTKSGKKVVLTATSNAQAKVTWGEARNNSTEAFKGTATKEFNARSGDIYTISVTTDFTAPEESHVVSCSIMFDGEEKETESESGEKGTTVKCMFTVP